MEVFNRNLYEFAEHCKFGTQRDEQIRDRIVPGILDKSLLQYLQMKSDLTHDTTIQMTRQSELVKFQVAGQSDDKHFGKVNQAKGKPNPQRGGNRNLPHKISKNTLFARSCSRCIENTSWNVLAYGIYTRVVFVSEIERVRFLIQKQRVGKYRTKHFTCGIVFILYILRNSSF